MASQSLRGNQSVQIQNVDHSSIQITYDQRSRSVPLEPAVIPVSAGTKSPTRLVRARSGVLPYAAREGLMDELEAWVGAEEPFAGRVIGGRGGSGKTRLAVELCRRTEAREWLCGFLSSAKSVPLDALVDVPTARLVVADYAESRLEQLEGLLPVLAARATEEWPVRVLLLVRASPRHTADWTERLRNRSDGLDALLDECTVRVLEDLPLQPTERETLFEAAARAFAERVDSSAATPGPPRVLGEDVFASPLLVVIAAYLAVHGTEAPSTRSALLDEVLAHEQRYWRASTNDLFKSDDVLPRRIVALATLAGAGDEAEAAQLLRLLPDLEDAGAERRTRLARWAHDEYPGPRWWNPLEPDLVGEHLVAGAFADHPRVLAGVLQREHPEGITQPVEVYARAAADHPRLATALRPILSAELERLCEAAVEQAATEADHDFLYGNATTAAAAIDRAISAVEVDSGALLPAIRVMPQRPDLVLGSLAVTLIALLVEHWRRLAVADPATYEPGLSVALNHLAARLGDVGRGEDALLASEDSVEIVRRLADVDGDAHAADLAHALHNLSNNLEEAGHRKEALATGEEAVEIVRRLAGADAGTYEVDLARALNNLSIRLGSMGRGEEALAVIEEVIGIRRRIAAADPSYEPFLAGSLRNLSVRLASVGRGEEALTAIEESVAITQRLAAANPAAYESELASGLQNLSNRLGDAGRNDEALRAIEESIEVNRRLAIASPAVYESELASALNNLSNRLGGLGRGEEALSAIEESAAIWRRLFEANPGAHEASLAGVLNNLANRLGDLGRHGEALSAIEESAAIRRRLFAANPGAHWDNMGRSLTNLAVRLENLGLDQEAGVVRQELEEHLASPANPAAP